MLGALTLAGDLADPPPMAGPCSSCDTLAIVGTPADSYLPSGHHALCPAVALLRDVVRAWQVIAGADWLPSPRADLGRELLELRGRDGYAVAKGLLVAADFAQAAPGLFLTEAGLAEAKTTRRGG